MIAACDNHPGVPAIAIKPGHDAIYCEGRDALGRALRLPRILLVPARRCICLCLECLPRRKPDVV
jgi:hypothetical protein